MGKPSEVPDREELRSANGCVFPEDRLYDVEHDIWFKKVGEVYRVGVNHPFLFFIGWPRKVRLRYATTSVRKNTSLAVIEASFMEGVLVSPVDCEITAVNEKLSEKPDLLAMSPYGEGWLVEIKANELPQNLVDASTASHQYINVNNVRRVVCFESVPHHRLTVFGQTCENILTQIGDFMNQYVKIGEVLLVVTGDPATEVDMMGWAEKTGNKILAIKRLGNLLYVAYRKTV